MAKEFVALYYNSIETADGREHVDSGWEVLGWYSTLEKAKAAAHGRRDNWHDYGHRNDFEETKED